MPLQDFEEHNWIKRGCDVERVFCSCKEKHSYKIIALRDLCLTLSIIVISVMNFLYVGQNVVLASCFCSIVA